MPSAEAANEKVGNSTEENGRTLNIIRAFDIFTESIAKPDAQLRNEAVDAGCQEELLRLREFVLETYIPHIRGMLIEEVERMEEENRKWPKGDYANGVFYNLNLKWNTFFSSILTTLRPLHSLLFKRWFS